MPREPIKYYSTPTYSVQRQRWIVAVYAEGGKLLEAWAFFSRAAADDYLRRECRQLVSPETPTAEDVEPCPCGCGRPTSGPMSLTRCDPNLAN